MNLFIEIITTVAIIAIIHIFFSGIFSSRRTSNVVLVALYVIYGTILTSISFIPSLSTFRLIYNTLAIIILPLILFYSKFHSALFAGISMSAILVLSEMLIMSVFSFLGLDVESLTHNDTARMICQITSPTVGLACVLIVRMLTKKQRNAISIPYIFMLLPGHMISIILGYEFCQIVITNQVRSPWLFLLSALGLTYLNILSVFYAERIKTSMLKEQEQALINLHYSAQEHYYEQLRKKQNETHALFHDINKYFCAMKALAAEAKSDESSKILLDVQNFVDNISDIVDVGNSIVSIILNEYIHKATENDIVLNYDISIPPKLNIVASDLYILLGNTLDNSIYACSYLPDDKRVIDLKLRLTNNILFYEVKNHYSEHAPKSSNDPHHGYGLKSVEKCVQKYDGNLLISKSNNQYILHARLTHKTAYTYPIY